MRWYMPSLSLPCWDFHFLTILRHPEERATGPREGAFSRPPLAESVIGARSFAGVTEDCCVGRVCHHHMAVGSRVELGDSQLYSGDLITEILPEIPLYISTIFSKTEQHKQMRIQ